MNSKMLITKFILSNLLKNSDEIELKETDSLIDKGIIDSLGIMKLIVYLEKEFDVKIANEEITLENFENIKAISCLVESKIS
jgi:acyl carrier protein